MFLFLLTNALAAEAQRWTVIGVAKGDTLSVRQEPKVGARIVGKLAAGAGGVEQVADHENGWIRVRSGKIEGWVNGRYLTPELPTSGKLPESLSCTGTEPFWGVRLEQGQGVYASPEVPEGSSVSVEVVRATHEAAFLVTPAPSGGWSWLTVALDPQTCSDGMSNRRYPYRTLALTDAQGFVAGCCRIPTAQ